MIADFSSAVMNMPIGDKPILAHSKTYDTINKSLVSLKKAIKTFKHPESELHPGYAQAKFKSVGTEFILS